MEKTVKINLLNRNWFNHQPYILTEGINHDIIDLRFDETLRPLQKKELIRLVYEQVLNIRKSHDLFLYGIINGIPQRLDNRTLDMVMSKINKLVVERQRWDENKYGKIKKDDNGNEKYYTERIPLQQNINEFNKNQIFFRTTVINPKKINFKNQSYDIMTREFDKPLTDIDRIAKYFINSTIINNYVIDNDYYILNKDEPNNKYGLHWLNTSFDKVKDIKWILGYALLRGNEYDKALMLVGKGGGGKSVLNRVLSAILGSNFTAYPFQSLNNDSEIIDMMESHICVLNEVTNLGKNSANGVAILKTMTSRYDPFKRRDLHQKGVDAKVYEDKPFVIVIGNNTPTTFDNVLTSRFWLIESKQVFRGTNKDIEDLVDKIINNPTELATIVNECIRTYLDDIEYGKEIATDVNRFKTLNTMNDFHKFIGNCLEFTGNEDSEKYNDYLASIQSKTFKPSDYKEYKITNDEIKDRMITYFDSINREISKEEITEYLMRTFSNDLEKIFSEYKAKTDKISVNNKKINCRFFLKLKEEEDLTEDTLDPNDPNQDFSSIL